MKKLLLFLFGLFVVGAVIIFTLWWIRRDMGWYNASWSKRIKLTVDNAKVGGVDQTGFPVYVNLDDLPDAFFSTVKSDGSDIVVTPSDGTTKLSRELVWIDTGAKTGELYFKGDLDTDADTDFYLYYGNSGASETNATTTWGDNYSGVYHLQTLNDSKGSNNITNSTSETATAVKIGNGYQLDDHGAYMNFGSAIVLSGDWSIQWWSRADNGDANNVIFNKAGSNTAYINYWAGNGFDVWRDGDSRVGLWNDATNFTTLQHWVLTNDSDGNAVLYQNGTALTAKTSAGANNFTIGQIGRSVDNTNSLKGYIDEIRFSSGVCLPQSWITAEYNNQSNTGTFYQVGTEESAPAGGNILDLTNANEGVTIQ